jgi:PGM1 C-terminal domain
MGQPCYYFASDNLRNPAYKGLIPDDLIDIAVDHELHLDDAAQQGVVFHLIGVLFEYGKLGMVCIGDSRTRAEKLYHDTASVLDREAQQ